MMIGWVDGAITFLQQLCIVSTISGSMLPEQLRRRPAVQPVQRMKREYADDTDLFLFPFPFL
jgi:hypothetical protein